MLLQRDWVCRVALFRTSAAARITTSIRRCRKKAPQLGATAVSRRQDRARMRAIIANAKRQWSGFAADATGDAAGDS